MKLIIANFTRICSSLKAQEILKKSLVCSRGAMDKILVTLLLVIVGIVALVGLETWASNQKKDMQNSSLDQINKVYNEANNN